MSERRRPAPPFNPEALVETVPRRVITERMLAHARLHAEETIDRDVLRAMRAAAAAGPESTAPAPTEPPTPGPPTTEPPMTEPPTTGPPTTEPRRGGLRGAWRSLSVATATAARTVGRVLRAPFRRRR